eukprot:gene23904-9471_t
MERVASSKNEERRERERQILNPARVPGYNAGSMVLRARHEPSWQLCARRKSTEDSSRSDRYSLGYHISTPATAPGRYRLPKPSEEQLAIMTAMQRGNNVKMVNKYYCPCRDDIQMKEMLHLNLPVKTSFGFDVVVVDEAQDMSPQLCKLTHKVVLVDNQVTKEAQLLVIGDKRQCIYRGADERHLVLASDVFKSQHEWVELDLLTSYRVTGNAASFINEVCLGGFQKNKMRSVKAAGLPVVYHRGCAFKIAKSLAAQLIHAMKYEGLKPQDIFVLTPSLRAGKGRLNPIQTLENLLVDAGYACYASTSDEEALSDNVIAGKVVFSTIHLSKGLERPCVVCFSFSAEWYTFYGRDENKKVCPNVLYVAITRATQWLHLVAEKDAEGHLPFLDLSSLSKLKERFPEPAVTVIDHDAKLFPATYDQGGARTKYSVTELTRHLAEESLEEAFKCLQSKKLQEPVDLIPVPNTIRGVGELTESISDINGLGLPHIYEYRSSGECTLLADLPPPNPGAKEWETVSAQKLRDQGKKLQEAVKSGKLSNSEVTASILELAAIVGTIQSNFVSRAIQVKNWDYIPESSVNTCMKVIGRLLHGMSVEYEKELEYAEYTNGTKYTIMGRADALTKHEIYEFKCVDDLRKEHFIQTAVYAWLWMNAEEDGERRYGSRKFRLLNIRTGELWEIEPDGIEDCCAVVLWAKIDQNKPAVSNSKFLDNCNSIHTWAADASQGPIRTQNYSHTPKRLSKPTESPKGPTQLDTRLPKGTYRLPKGTDSPMGPQPPKATQTPDQVASAWQGAEREKEASGRRREGGNPFKCQQCSRIRSFKTKKGLIEHERLHHV